MLRAVDLAVLASALNFLVMAGALVYAFIREGRRDKRRAKTWGDLWRRRHLMMIALSLLIGFSAVLIPNSEQSVWVLVPILLAIIPLMFTPFATVGHAPSPNDEGGEGPLAAVRSSPALATQEADAEAPGRPRSEVPKWASEGTGQR